MYDVAEKKSDLKVKQRDGIFAFKKLRLCFSFYFSVFVGLSRDLFSLFSFFIFLKSANMLRECWWLC